MTLDVRAVTAADEPALLALHRRCFGPPPWDAARLAWRLHDLAPEDLGRPGGASFLGAFAPDGACLAMFGGVRQRFALAGEPCFVLGHSDVAVAPELRGGLGGSRLLARLAQEFIGAQKGGETAVLYGIPEPALRRVVLRAVRSEILCDLVWLAHRLDREPAAPADVETRVVGAPDADADALWARCAPELEAATVRDRRYLDARFARHPGVRYELVEARGADGELRGFAALREGGWSPHVATLAEWLAPREDRDAERALAAHAVRYARARGKQALVAWFPAPEPRFVRFQAELGFLAHPSPYQVIFSTHRNGFDRRRMHEGWYLTVGDVDFF